MTGFGFIGHALEIARGRPVALRVDLARVPFLDGAATYAAKEYFPGGACRNEDCYRPETRFSTGISLATQMLLFTPETSGGLLAAVDADGIDAVLAACAEAGEPCWIIGEVEPGAGLYVHGELMARS